MKTARVAIVPFLLLLAGCLLADWAWCRPPARAVCSPDVGLATINEVYIGSSTVADDSRPAWWKNHPNWSSLSLKTPFVEVVIHDAATYPWWYFLGWHLEICYRQGNRDVCGATYPLFMYGTLGVESFPYLLAFPVPEVSLNSNARVDIVLKDLFGLPVDYLSINGYTRQQPACAFPYDTDVTTHSRMKGVHRLPDKTGDWQEYISPGSTASPTPAAPNSGAEGVVDHYRIEHPASALTCQAAAVTVRACRDAGCSTYYQDTVDLTLAPASGWIGGNEQSLVGGSGTFRLRQGSAGTVVLGLSANPAAAGATRCYSGGIESNCAMTFYDAGFLVSVPDQRSCQASAAPFIQAVRKDDETEACVADGGFADRSKVVNFWTDYLLPAGGGKALRLNGTALATAAPGTAVAVSFDSQARSSLPLAYDDAGQLRLNARYVGSGEETGLVMTGSDSFVVAPHSLRVRATSDGATPLDNNTSSGTPHWPAGEDFTLEVAGVCEDGTVTANFAADTALSAADPFQPAAGERGNLSGGALPAADYRSGVAVNSAVSYSEVGTVTIAALVTNYLGSGIDVTGSSAAVGRFTPHHFAVSLNTPQFASGCAGGGFTYLGQPFDYAMAPVITVTAQNKQNGTTRNYSGDWWKISSGAGGSLTGKIYSAATGSLDSSNVPVDDPTVSALGGGLGLLTFATGDGLAFDRAAPMAPFEAEIALQIDLVDGDSIAYADNPVRFGAASTGNGIAFDAGKQMRWGRLALDNAYGSELLPLAMPLQAEYYDGTAFIANGADSCTGLSLAQLNLSNASGSVTADRPIGVGSGTTSASLLSPLVAGDAHLSFSAPGDDGYVDVTVDLGLLDWLRYDWDGDGLHDDDPSGRATFGIYGGRPGIIYRRETFR